MEMTKVLPIKDDQILKRVEDTLLNHFQYGIRNYTIFQMGKVTLLKSSDLLKLHYIDAFDEQGNVKLNTYFNSSTVLYLDPVEVDLVRYRIWRETYHVDSSWLFPSMQDQQKHLSQNHAKSRRFVKFRLFRSRYNAKNRGISNLPTNSS